MRSRRWVTNGFVPFILHIWWLQQGYESPQKTGVYVEFINIQYP